MTSKFLRSVLAIAVISMISAWAQTGSAATPCWSPAPPQPLLRPSQRTGTKVGTINMEQAVFGSNEGRATSDALTRSWSPSKTN